MKFIHCSDIHLDSPMESNLSAAQARERNAEICRTFARMAQYAVEHGVTAVLLAGDLFDTGRVSATTGAFILDTIAAAAPVQFLYLRGNHDDTGRAFGGRPLPDNLVTFTDRPTSVAFGSTTVTAVELTDGNCRSFYDDLQLRPADTNILMLHGQISHTEGEELVCLPRLRGKHIDYLALGHIHSYRAEALDDRGTWCYCGCIEGRGFDECGEKGFVLLEVADGTVTHSFVPFAARTLYEVTADITGLTETPAILAAMNAAAATISADSLVKFTLQGTYTPDTHKDIPFLQTMLEGRFYAVKIKDESRLALAAADYENDISLKGEFVRTVLASHLPQEDKDRIIVAGLAALRGEELGL